MPTDKRPLKVFLCHAHADRDAVRALYTRLTNDGVDAWLDKEKLLPGQDWELEIKKAVREADVVVVCLSKQFNQAGFRQKEVRLALDVAMEKREDTIFIIPARLEECDNLESLRKWHWVDLFEKDGYEMLVRALSTRADNIGSTLQIKSKRKLDNLKKSKNVKIQTNSAMSTRAVLSAIALMFIILSFILIPFLGNLNGGDDKPGIDIVLSSVPSIVNPTITSTKENVNLSPTLTQIDATSSTTTLLPNEIQDAKGVSMVLVPEGEFVMGDENSLQRVYLDGFYMDKYEVTNFLYKLCVDMGGCETPRVTTWKDEFEYYGNSKYYNYPVAFIDWYQAEAYCKWRDARLPTEAEWEKSARGTDGRTYPWGEDIACSKANYCQNYPTQVGSYENGKSPYGIYDLSGNIWEWTSDWAGSTDSDENTPIYNPTGPITGQYKILRGGVWFNETEQEYLVQIVNSFHADYPVYVSFFGVRCAKDAP